MNVNSSTLAPDRSEVNVLILNTKIKTKTVTGTTSGTGYISGTTVDLAGKTIIAVLPTDGQYVALPYAGNGVMVYTRAMNPVLNTSVTLTITYI